MLEVFAPFFLCMDSNALEKSMNRSIVLRFFTRTPSMILRDGGQMKKPG